jgi:hypothetical protein
MVGAQGVVSQTEVKPMAAHRLFTIRFYTSGSDAQDTLDENLLTNDIVFW